MFTTIPLPPVNTFLTSTALVVLSTVVTTIVTLTIVIVAIYYCNNYKHKVNTTRKKIEFVEKTKNKYGYKNTHYGNIDSWRGRYFKDLIKPVDVNGCCYVGGGIVLLFDKLLNLT